jgi:hypothetical protein
MLCYTIRLLVHAERHPMLKPLVLFFCDYPTTSLHTCVLLQQKNADHSHDQRRESRRRRHERSRKRSCFTAAFAVVGDVVCAGSDLEDGAVDGALVVEVDEEEVRRAAPVSCVWLADVIFSRD